jgi:hypothetical protein
MTLLPLQVVHCVASPPSCKYSRLVQPLCFDLETKKYLVYIDTQHIAQDQSISRACNSLLKSKPISALFRYLQISQADLASHEVWELEVALAELQWSVENVQKDVSFCTSSVFHSSFLMNFPPRHFLLLWMVEGLLSF